MLSLQEGDHAHQRDQNLREAAAERRHQITKRRENDVAGFVKRQTDRMQERSADDLLLHRPEEKEQRPAHEQDEQQDTARGLHAGRLYYCADRIRRGRRSVPVSLGVRLAFARGS